MQKIRNQERLINGEIKMPKIEAKLFTKDHMTPLTKKIKYKLLKNEMPETEKSYEQMMANFLYQFLTMKDRR